MFEAWGGLCRHLRRLLVSTSHLGQSRPVSGLGFWGPGFWVWEFLNLQGLEHAAEGLAHCRFEWVVWGLGLRVRDFGCGAAACILGHYKHDKLSRRIPLGLQSSVPKHGVGCG